MAPVPGTAYLGPHRWKFGKCVRCVALPVATPARQHIVCMWFTLHLGSQCVCMVRCFRCGKGEGDEAKLRRIRIETAQEQARRRYPHAF